MLRWAIAVVAMAGCGADGQPSTPFCEDLGCVARNSIACNAQGACSCDGTLCVADKPHVCFADASETACADLMPGWLTYECNADWADPPDSTCLHASELKARFGVDWISVRCCKPSL